jgi:uncharacterized protein YlaN (UPF0358 family)
VVMERQVIGKEFNFPLRHIGWIAKRLGKKILQNLQKKLHD